MTGNEGRNTVAIRGIPLLDLQKRANRRRRFAAFSFAAAFLLLGFSTSGTAFAVTDPAPAIGRLQSTNALVQTNDVVRFDDPVLRWLPEIVSASTATGLGPEYIAAVIRLESGGDPNAVSVAGARGLMQVMPAEFNSQGVPEASWHDPATNILVGSTEIAKHLAATGSIEGALATYFGSGCDALGTCTDAYISIVLGYAAEYAGLIANGGLAALPAGWAPPLFSPMVPMNPMPEPQFPMPVTPAPEPPVEVPTEAPTELPTEVPTEVATEVPVETPTEIPANG